MSKRFTFTLEVTIDDEAANQIFGFDLTPEQLKEVYSKILLIALVEEDFSGMTEAVDLKEVSPAVDNN